MTESETPDFVKHFLYSAFMDNLISWKMKDSCEYHVEEFKKLDEKHKTFGLTPVWQEEKQDHLDHAKAFKKIYIYGIFFYKKARHQLHFFSNKQE